MDKTIDMIFLVCSAIAMVGLTAMLLAFCGAVIYGVVRMAFYGD